MYDATWSPNLSRMIKEFDPLEIGATNASGNMVDITQHGEGCSEELRRWRKKCANLIQALRSHVQDIKQLKMDIEVAKRYQTFVYRQWPRKFHYMIDRIVNGKSFKPVKQKWTFLRTDVVNFTKRCEGSSDLSVSQFLTEMNDRFAQIFKTHRVLRLPEVGDAMLVASKSGLKIMRTALDMLKEAQRFGKGSNGKPLTNWLRFGVHTGTIVFGSPDKQNPTASGLALSVVSRLEKHGKAFRIHVSSATKKRLEKELLQNYSTISDKIKFIKRDPVIMKGLNGKRIGPTYWAKVQPGSF